MTAPATLPPLVVRALLGLRFVDFATGRPIEGGLRVTARPIEQPHRPIAGVVGPSGIVSLHHLTGLHDLEYPTLAGGGGAPGPRTFVVTVDDRRGWFLRTLFLIDLPLLAPGTSLPQPAEVPLTDAFLFSQPGRPVPPGFAAIRADLRDAITMERVGHAVLRVDLAGTAGLGVADESGHVLVLLPAPALDRLRLGSPPGMGQSSRQTWPVTVRAFALPGLAPPTLPGGRLPPPWRTLPTLKAILDSQPPAPVYLSPGTPAAAWTDTLTYGDDLVLRTQTSSYLLIAPGASPP